MARKNSSKTVTEKAMSASNPKMQTFTGWNGVNFKESSLDWYPMETGKANFAHQTDLNPKNFLLQNNMITCTNLTVETRQDSIVIGDINDITLVESTAHKEFTGVCCMFRKWLFVVVRLQFNNKTESYFRDEIFHRDLTDNSMTWYRDVFADDQSSIRENYTITEIGYYENQFIALTMHHPDGTGDDELYEAEIFTGQIKYNPADDSIYGAIRDTYQIRNIIYLYSAAELPTPVNPANVEGMGDLEIFIPSGDPDETVPDNMVARLTLTYVYTNKFGSTLPADPVVVYTSSSPLIWSAYQYLKITGNFVSGATGVDIYAANGDSQDMIFIGHVDIPADANPNTDTWWYNWFGALTDVSQWTTVQLTVPEENTTKGVHATHFANHDSRLYFWGDPEHPYRLYIGGRTGAELSVARGFGGAFVDIEPGSGIEVKGTAKWKTTQGANIITILCGHPNTTLVKRFNLIETSISITTEIAANGYMYEEVSNVIGCNSRWGYGVFADGLYAISRYGLMLTTMAMEYNNQMRNTDVSEPIKPIFTERLGTRTKDCRMVYIDDVIYIILSEEPRNTSGKEDPPSLDRVILCYDLQAKAWYTFTHDGQDDLLLHAFAVDSDEYIEGLGVVSKNEIYLYPTTGVQDETVPNFDVLLQTGELSVRMPQREYQFLDQLEFHFDYLISDPDDPPEIIISGVDYYGRPFEIVKKINIKSRGNHGVEHTVRNWREWIKVGKICQSYWISIKGRMRCRLTHINTRLYTFDSKIEQPYGYDAHDTYTGRKGQKVEIHHYIDDYNNLRRAIIP